MDRLELAVYLGEDVACHVLPRSGRLTIGRAPGNDIRLDDVSVSRRHAVLDLGPPSSVEDLGSANGTRVRKPNEPLEMPATYETHRDPGETFVIGLGDRMIFGAVTAVIRRAPAEASAGEPMAVLTPRMKALHEQAQKAAQEPSSVLLLGETGVGKEMLAREIHRLAAGIGPVPDGVVRVADRGAARGGAASRVGEPAAPRPLRGGGRGHGAARRDRRSHRARAGQAAARARGARGAARRRAGASDARRALPGVDEPGSGGEGPARGFPGEPLLPARRDHPRRPSAARADRRDRAAGAAVPRRCFAADGAVAVAQPLVQRARGARAVHVAGERARAAPDDGARDGALLRRGRARRAPAAVDRGHGAQRSSTRAAPSSERVPLSVGSLEELDAARDALERRRIVEALDRCGGNQTLAAGELGITRRTLVARLGEYGLLRQRKRE